MTESMCCLRCQALRRPPSPCSSCGYQGYTLEEWGSHLPGMARVASFVRDGKKIEAVKLLRELTGLGLKESLEALETFTAGAVVDLPLRSPPAALLGGDADREDTEVAMERELLTLAQGGQLLEAIKRARAAKGLSLAEAKAYVEQLLASAELASVVFGTPEVAQGLPEGALQLQDASRGSTGAVQPSKVAPRGRPGRVPVVGAERGRGSLVPWALVAVVLGVAAWLLASR